VLEVREGAVILVAFIAGVFFDRWLVERSSPADRLEAHVAATWGDMHWAELIRAHEEEAARRAAEQ
jgi:hypothetical protein